MQIDETNRSVSAETRPSPVASPRVLAIVGCVSLALALGIGMAVLIANPDSDLGPLNPARANLLQTLHDLTDENSGGLVPGAAGLAGAAQDRLSRADAWLRGQGVEEVALPAAARAYRAEYGHPLDQDLPQYGDDVQEWVIKWQAAYKAGEPWARGMAQQQPQQ